MKEYSKEVLEAENRIIMKGHHQAVKDAVTPLIILIVVSVGSLAVFGLYHLVNVIFA